MTTSSITWKEFPTPIASSVPEGFVEVKSKYTGELEKGRKRIVKFLTDLIMPVTIATRWAMTHQDALAAGVSGADKIRSGFQTLLDTFTALAEPVLWFYALIGCIMIATGKNKDAGWNRIKQVGYAYVAIALLPTLFSLLRWVSVIIKGAIQF
jgi:hypothetical protein